MPSSCKRNGMSSMSNRLNSTSLQDFAVSGLAAGLSHIIHHPLYTLKSQMMFYGQHFRMKSFAKKVLKEKHKFLYRGVISRTLGIMPEKAFKMQGFFIVKKLIDYQNEKSFIIKWLIAGSAAGAATTIIGCPSERVMVLAQVQKQTVVQVIRSTGLFGLYYGFWATLYRDIVFNMLFFTSREVIVREYERKYLECPDAWKRVMFGITAGCCASIVACPLDVIKTRLQGNELSSRDISFTRVVASISKEGYRYFFKGLIPRLISVPSMMSVFYVFNEELSKYIEA